VYTFPDAPPLKLGGRSQDMHLKLPGSVVASITRPSSQTIDAQRLEFVQERVQMPEVPAEPIEAPADHYIEPSASGVHSSNVRVRR